MRSDHIKLMLISGIACSILTNGVQFGIQYKLGSNTKAKYEKQIANYRQTLEEIGELTTCYTVATPKSKAGEKVISEEAIEEIQIPASCVQDTFVTDYSEIKDKEYKIEIHKGTPLTKDMFMDKEINDSTRHIDISATVFPTDLVVGDYIDFRIIYPKGEDYIVLPKVRVDAITGNTINVMLNEEDIIFYDAACVDNFMNSKAGSVLYMTKYVEPGLQAKAHRTYSIPTNIQTLITNNPNIVQDVQQGTVDRDVMERFGVVTNEELSALGSGRGALISKLQQARDTFTQNQKEANDLQAADDLDEQLEVEDAQTSVDEDTSEVVDPNPNNSIQDVEVE